MGQVIDLAAKQQSDRCYRELLGETLQRLDAAADMLMEDLVNLAMHGPWREWSEAQQVGAISHVDGNALADCGDPLIVELNGALRRMREAVETVRETSHSGET
jgi:hypothetical protein